MKSHVLTPPRSYEQLRSLLPDVEETHLDASSSLETYTATAYSLEEECARVRAQRGKTLSLAKVGSAAMNAVDVDAEVALEIGLRRKNKARDKARKRRVEEEAKRERTNREALVMIERMESEARAKANLSPEEASQNPPLCVKWRRSPFQFRHFKYPEEEEAPFIQSL